MNHYCQSLLPMSCGLLVCFCDDFIFCFSSFPPCVLFPLSALYTFPLPPDAPHFGDNSDIPEPEAGHDLILTLNVTANPPINHSLWFIDGRPLVNSTGRYSFSHSSLNITGLKHTDDRSMIQLNVSNSIGSNVFSFNLSVLCKLMYMCACVNV